MALRLISPEPRFLNLLDEFLKSQPSILATKNGFFRIGMDFAKEVAVFMRSRQNLVATVGSVFSVEILTRMIRAEENG